MVLWSASTWHHLYLIWSDVQRTHHQPVSQLLRWHRFMAVFLAGVSLRVHHLHHLHPIIIDVSKHTSIRRQLSVVVVDR